jgi:glutaredoxin
MAYNLHIQTFKGEPKKDIMVFSLSDKTCIWCDKTKDLLKRMGLQFSYIDVDLLDKDDQNEAYKEMWRFVPNSTTFPTVVINNGEFVVSGFSEQELKALLQL